MLALEPEKKVLCFAFFAVGVFWKCGAVLCKCVFYVCFAFFFGRLRSKTFFYFWALSSKLTRWAFGFLSVAVLHKRLFFMFLCFLFCVCWQSQKYFFCFAKVCGMLWRCFALGVLQKKTVLQFCFAERFFIFILQYGFCCNKSLLALPVA